MKWAASLLLLLMPLAAFAYEDALPDVNVVVDLTKAGKKARSPTPGHPVYYYPKMAPYTEEGGSYANDQAPPPPNAIAHELAVALARQGYLVAVGKQRPDIVLAIIYGSINPVYVSMPGPGRHKSVQVMLNQADMVAMVQGDDVHGLDVAWIRKQIMDQLHYDRYFFMVTALDFNSFGPGKNPETLWRARISIPAVHVYFGDVVKTLIDKGVPFFGHDARPQHIEIPTVPAGHVEVGTPTLKNPQPAQ